MERHCQLCRALNSLPEIQGRRIDAHYLLGQSRKDIAEAEGVSQKAVGKAIQRGLEAMRKYFQENLC
jgi:RNA polymerase sigma-70 factor (ECF subfamily)